MKRNTIGQGDAPRYTPVQLRSLVHAAQKGDRQAIDALCRAFKPLIFKEAHRSRIISALGEDAVNTAWKIFLEFIHAYRREHFELLPGLIRRTLHYRLLDEAIADRALPQAADFAAECGEILAGEGDALESSRIKISLQSALRSLPPGQRLLVQKVYLEGMSMEEYARFCGSSLQNAYQTRNRALAGLRKILQQQPPV